MANVRDPAFWKRFSMAVHIDEEQAATQPELKHSDSWLARQQRKKSRRTYVCCAFWLCFALFVAAIVGIIIWAINAGVFDDTSNGKKQQSTSRRDISQGQETSSVELVVRWLVEGVGQ